MSMRPRDPSGARNVIGRQRMAPGGRGKPWSQSPIPRTAVRRVRAAGVPFVCPFPISLRPDTITIDTLWSGAGVYTLVGGGGAGTLADDSDTTYLRLTYPSSNPGAGPHTDDGTILTFAAMDLPAGASITDAILRVRIRTSGADNTTYQQWIVAQDIVGTQTPLYEEQTGNAIDPANSGSNVWLDYANPLVVFDALPSVADVEAGVIQCRIKPATTAGSWDGRTVDIAEVTLELDGTCP